MNKPYVICHMVASIDGRISTWRGTDPEGRTEYERTAATYQADAWICAAYHRGTAYAHGTSRSHPLPLPASAKTDFFVPAHTWPLRHCCRPSGRLTATNAIDGDHVVAVLTEHATGFSVSHLSASATRVVSLRGHPDD